ncbi:MAG TPA: hypothetical protein VL049_03300 [Candidatus Dormibacteraeota bacterium]|nr:hypothetical protein [Candidatus Dormibacteraeota bacterium]
MARSEPFALGSEARVEEPGRALDVARTDDVVVGEDAARLVSGHLHRQALGDAGVDEVPHRGAPEVVRDFSAGDTWA